MHAHGLPLGSTSHAQREPGSSPSAARPDVLDTPRQGPPHVTSQGLCSLTRKEWDWFLISHT